jgi:hypothetical protein
MADRLPALVGTALAGALWALVRRLIELFEGIRKKGQPTASIPAIAHTEFSIFNSVSADPITSSRGDPRGASLKHSV